MGNDAVERAVHFLLNHDIDSHIFYPVMLSDSYRDEFSPHIYRHCFPLAVVAVVENHQFPKRKEKNRKLTQFYRIKYDKP